MRMLITGRDTYRLLAFIAATAIIAVMIPTPLPAYYRIVFFAYAWSLYGIIRSAHVHADSDHPMRSGSLSNVLLFGSLGIVLLSRIIPFIRYGMSPLGYDTGFYWQYFNIIIPAGGIGTATTAHLAYASWFPFAALGLSALFTIQSLHVINQFLTVGALYLLLRSIVPGERGRAVAACGAFLFAVSVNQFFAYWWMFYKQSFALPFFLFALALFFRRSWLAIPVAAFAAAIHLPTAIPLGVGFALLVLYSLIIPLVRRQPIPRETLVLAIGGIVTIAIMSILKGADDLQYYWSHFLKYRGFATNARSWEVEQIKGLFIPSSAFRLTILYYLPFSLIGAIELLGLRRLRAHGAVERSFILITTIAVLVVLTGFPFIHQQRSLILLDLLLITVAAAPFAHFVKYGFNGWPKRIALGLLLFGLTSSLTYMVWHQEPQLYADEAKELSVLARTGDASDIRKIDDYVMVTSAIYTPWAFAYTGFGPTIVPGWLTWDKWGLSQWETFWSTDDARKRLDLLRMYGDHNIYIFVGRRVLDWSYNAPLLAFLKTDPHFTQFSPHIWKYSPFVNIPAGDSQ